MLSRILKTFKLYGIQVVGGTIHNLLKDARWVFMGTEKGCPLFYLVLHGKEYNNAYMANGVTIGEYYGPKDNLPDISAFMPIDYINDPDVS